jgi:hypothetical protein
VIGEVDSALEALVRRDAVNGGRVDVMFDAPTKDWVARRNAPAIDLYLYDIREDLARRQVQMEPSRDSTTGFVTARRMPPRRFRLSYLVTAWTQRPEDEHRLLSSLLRVFVRNEFIPSDLVDGSLARSPFPVLLSVCLPPPQDRSIADVWSALGGELKPSLELVATAPFDVDWIEPAAAPVREAPTLDVGGPGLTREVMGGGPQGAAARDRRPLGPDSEAQQVEIIQAAAGDARRSMIGKAPPKRPPRGGKGAGPGEPAGTSIEEVEGGRIVRLRGVSRP